MRAPAPALPAEPSTQGSSSRSRPRSLSREASVRSVPLWCDQLLFCYNSLLIIMDCPLFHSKNPAPKSCPFRRQAPHNTRPNRPPSPPRLQAHMGTCAHARACESACNINSAIRAVSRTSQLDETPSAPRGPDSCYFKMA